MFYICVTKLVAKQSCKSYTKLNTERQITFSKINHNLDKVNEQMFNRQRFCNNLIYK